MVPRRPLLAIVLGLFAIALALGGAWLLSLGGSAYYLLAGLIVGASAYFVWRGERRGIWLYGLFLLATLLWALWERGTFGWALQARLAAPAVLGLFVFWPLLHAGLKAAALAAVAAAIAFSMLITPSERPLVVATDKAPSTLATGGRTDWQQYGNSLAGTRFSPITQIDSSNVAKLQPAWTFRTGVMKTGLGLEVTPLMVGDTLYICTPNNIVIALDSDTGERKWSFDAKPTVPPTGGTCRGVAYFKVPDGTGACAERIIFATVDARLMAVDAASGQACADFGANGTVDLWHGMGKPEQGYYYVTSAPTIVNGNIVLGGWISDGQYLGEPSGVVRAFNASTGQFAWAWDMDKPDFHGEPAAGETYSRGTANSWAPMSGDEQLGLVYLPTGNATPDYWGALRTPGSEKYSSAVVAVDSRTGAARWVFQTSHHDVWDYDVASQPTLIDLPVGNETIPAVIVPTKRGQVFLLDRRDGKPISEVTEVAVPQGPAEGDYLSPTQPFSTGMPAFDNTVLSEAQMWGATPLDQLWCRIKYRQARYEGPMTPPGVKPTITYPSYLGGVDWGGVSVDPERAMMVVNYSRVANYTRLVPRAEADAMGVNKYIGQVHVGIPVAQKGTPFAAYTGAFLSPLQMPCNEPPFGMIAAVDLKTRKVTWQRPLGTAADSGPKGIASHIKIEMGVPNSGGSIITRSGLIFIAATQEKSFRAFDLATGQKLWSSRLPAGGHASPMTYISSKSGRQYVVIAAGGNASLMSGAGDYIMAYALPKNP
jgi:quinoprotein glucose dehydrogenase